MRILLITLALAAWPTLVPSQTNGQTDKPVYVQYEGFIKQNDGSLVLSFGYFNMNDADVTIPVGNRNQFLPVPANRHQTVTFLKGRHRSGA